MIPTLRRSAEEYVRMRRGLGYKLVSTEALLAEFVTWCEQRAITAITTESALEWAVSSPTGSTTWRAQRLSAVRVFARYRVCFDPDTEVPPVDLLPAPLRRRVPFIYTDEQVATLMDACRQVVSPAGKASTCAFLIGLLACAGMRISEACLLTIGDIGTAEVQGRTFATLTIDAAKGGRARTIPLDPSASAAIDAYLSDRGTARSGDPLIAVAGEPFAPRQIRVHVWPRLLAHTRVGTGTEHPPRLHDFRHTMAVRRLISWYAEDVADIDARIAWLSTYLGHADPASTYWYLQAVPELLAVAGQRGAASWQVLP